jgi:hypothetical protein
LVITPVIFFKKLIDKDYHFQYTGFDGDAHGHAKAKPAWLREKQEEKQARWMILFRCGDFPKGKKP